LQALPSAYELGFHGTLAEAPMGSEQLVGDIDELTGQSWKF